MIPANELAKGYGVNLRIVQLQTEGLSHEDSLVQTQFNINSLNWVLGHIAVNRDNVLMLLGEEPLLGESETDRYKRGSEPVQEEGNAVLSLSELLDVLQRGQEKIETSLSSLLPANFEKEIMVGSRTMTLGSRLFGFYFHDTYHTGQTDLLRQVAGKNDQVIR